MVVYEDECIGCPKEIGCLGSSCPYRDVPYLYCDECKEDVEDLYLYTDKNGFSFELCRDCLLNKFPKINY